jgi:hypothetical protein
LTEGQFVPLVDGDKTHWVEVLELRPSKAVIIDAGRDKYLDLVIDFAPAVDFDDSDEISYHPTEDEVHFDLPPPSTPTSGNKLGSDFKFDSELETCQNCGKEVPKTKLKMHETHCFRNVYKCEACNTTMLVNDKADHDYLYHRNIQCECGEDIPKSSLKMHKLSKCPERIRFCLYCKIPINESQREKHQGGCEQKPKEDKKEDNILIGKRDEGNSLIGKREENTSTGKKLSDSSSSTSKDGDPTENVLCEICKRSFPKSRITMHKIRCK